MDSSISWKSNEMVKYPVTVKQENLENNCYNKSEVGQHLSHGTKGYVFGPFAPESVNKSGVLAQNGARRAQDWESLAPTDRPHYHNQGKALCSKFPNSCNFCRCV